MPILVKIRKGFWRGEGRILAFSIDLPASSPLKHSRTTVRVCDHRVKNRTSVVWFFRHRYALAAALYDPP